MGSQRVGHDWVIITGSCEILLARLWGHHLWSQQLLSAWGCKESDMTERLSLGAVRSCQPDSGVITCGLLSSSWVSWHSWEQGMVDRESPLVSGGIWVWIWFLPLYSCTFWTERWTPRSLLKERLVVQPLRVLLAADFHILVSRLPQLHRAACPRSTFPWMAHVHNWLSGGISPPFGPMQDNSNFSSRLSVSLSGVFRPASQLSFSLYQVPSSSLHLGVDPKGTFW